MTRNNLPWLSLIMTTGLLVSCLSTRAASPGDHNRGPSETTKQLVVQVPRLVKEEVRYADGSLSQATIITYDTNGNPILEEVYNQKRALVFSKRYLLSADGLTQTVTTATPIGETLGVSVRHLDQKGQILKESLLNDKGQLQSLSEYSWDKAGNLISWISRDPDLDAIITTNYLLTEDKVTAIEILDAHGILVKRFVQSWDGQGRLVRKTEIDPLGGPIMVIDYQYQGKFLQRENYRKPDGGLVRSIEYGYNGLDVPSQVRILDGNGQVNEIRRQDYQIFNHTEAILVVE